MRSNRGSQPRARHGLVVTLGVAALATAGLGGFAGPLTAHAAPITFYFSGLPGNGDDGTRTAGSPTATFGATAPTGAAPSTQTSAPAQIPTPCGDRNYSYWTGTLPSLSTGTVHIDWWWQTQNPDALAQGATVDIYICANGTQIGGLSAYASGPYKPLPIGPTPTESTFDVPITVTGTLTNPTFVILAAPHYVNTGQRNTVLYNATTEPSFFTINSGGPPPTPTPTPTATPTITPNPNVGTGPQLFHNYAAPIPYPHVENPPNCTVACLLFGEPSIGVDWGTNTTMYQGDLNTWQVQFAYSKGVIPTATWNDRSDTATSSGSLDARLIDDHAGLVNDRTFVEQLLVATAAQAYSNNDGGTAAPPANNADWIPGVSSPGQQDHESIAAGRYSQYVALPTGAQTVYPNALYYCSQEFVQQPPIDGAFCARSDNGGVSYGAPVQIYTTSQCGGLHGKPAVGPDGVVYIPNKSCGTGQDGIVISKDNGATWTVVIIPGSSNGTDGNQLDPGVAVGGGSFKGEVYYTYRDGNHHVYVVTSTDDGSTWSTPVDLGSSLGLQNTQMTEVVAGDQSRAAVTFLGTTCSGDDSVEGLSCNGSPAVWSLYVAYTYDGGANWQVVNAAPGDPVQVGGICAGGTGCATNGDGSTSRNMLDFNDITVDNHGRVQVAYTDGCTGTCETKLGAGAVCPIPDVTGPVNPTVCLGRNSSVLSMFNQTCGVGLFANFDPGFNNDPKCTNPSNIPESPIASLLTLGGGAVALGVGLYSLRRRRRGPPAPIT